MSSGEIHYSKGNWMSKQSDTFTALLIWSNCELQLVIKRQRYFFSSSSMPHITLWWIYQLSFVVLNWLKHFFFGVPVSRCTRELIGSHPQLFSLANELCPHRQEGSAAGKTTRDCGITSWWLPAVRSLGKIRARRRQEWFPSPTEGS